MRRDEGRPQRIQHHGRREVGHDGLEQGARRSRITHPGPGQHCVGLLRQLEQAVGRRDGQLAVVLVHTDDEALGHRHGEQRCGGRGRGDLHLARPDPQRCLGREEHGPGGLATAADDEQPALLVLVPSRRGQRPAAQDRRRHQVEP